MIAGRYALLAELGRGGMGVVWRAQDRVIGRQVAIKELHIADGVPPEERRVLEERVLREARTAGKLNDPGVVTVFDVVSDGGVPWVVMELVEAPTLATLISARGPMPQEQVVSIAQQSLSALEAAHQAGIVHRDVKPGNLMIRADGRVKLTDFGIAQAHDDPRLTTSGSLIGSPAYMSPERLHGHDASAASDLWALGATLCYAVEGWSPFERSSTASTLHAIMNETPRLTRAQGVLGAVITGLLIGDPNARLSAPQARAMLNSIGNQPTPPQGLPPAATAHLQQGPAVDPAKKKRNRILALVAAVVIAAGAFTGGIFAHRAFSTPPAAKTALTYGETGDIPVFELYGEGQCADGQLVAGKQITNESKTDTCTESHDIEVFDEVPTFDESSSSKPDVSYPGKEPLTTLGVARCQLTFDSALVVDKADLQITVLVPTQAAWEEKNPQRKIFCVTSHKNGDKLAKSVLAKKDS
ncbi:serine/threonine protein kinase [Lentzea tibetensis]|uniref:non-specific serine/threonine protein kinase n=1 Tax=Lentzea tibetensis TaxID=2591470 RepID=A0A563ES62_9PSEU|nr:serine/threonine protein kinase [Lentzea tibetensis]